MKRAFLGRAVLVALLAVGTLLFLGGSLPPCGIGGVGPVFIAQRAACAEAWRNSLPPLERFQYDYPLAWFAIVFVGLVAAMLAAEWAWRHRPGSSSGEAPSPGR
jgi:hypothetical protein